MTHDHNNDDVTAKQDESRIDTARAAIGGAIDHARGAAGDGLETARAKLGDGLHVAKDGVSAAYASAKDVAGGVTGRAASAVEENPLATLIGSLALGALAGALLPRSQREIEALTPLGERIRAAAGNAGDAAKAAGLAKLDELGFNKDDLLTKAREVIEQAITAARTSGGAAASAAGDAARDAVQS